ncbi:MAG: 30S ribosomal protein S14 [Gammaproteobacteria bacterium]|nr:MAG: 30S ribosomal protein S14 [Gammaproteobacteria bacterium]
MAKQSMIQREIKRTKLVKIFAKKRADLKKNIKNPDTQYEDKIKAMSALSKLPRDSSVVRGRNRCNLTGRPHGFYRKFGLSRNKLREHAMLGNVPGLTKASW